MGRGKLCPMANLTLNGSTYPYMLSCIDHTLVMNQLLYAMYLLGGLKNILHVGQSL